MFALRITRESVLMDPELLPDEVELITPAQADRIFMNTLLDLKLKLQKEFDCTVTSITVKSIDNDGLITVEAKIEKRCKVITDE